MTTCTVLLVLLGQSPGSLVTSRPGGCWLQFWYAIIMVARQYGWERLCDSRWLRKMSNRQFEKVALLIKYYPVIGQEIRCILPASLQTVNTFKNLTDFAKQTCFQISNFSLLHKLAYRCRYETMTTLVGFFVLFYMHLNMTLNIYVFL